MSKLEEIEAAAATLPRDERQKLMLFLVTRMRSQDVEFPEPRKFSGEQMAAWIAEDEADMRRFQQGK